MNKNIYEHSQDQYQNNHQHAAMTTEDHDGNADHTDHEIMFRKRFWVSPIFAFLFGDYPLEAKLAENRR
jgi:ABC-type Zn2+ transport system substrate-binding protein/surface adhesin